MVRMSTTFVLVTTLAIVVVEAQDLAALLAQGQTGGLNLQQVNFSFQDEIISCNWLEIAILNL